jgi:dihydroneopterin aldolase
MMQRNQQILALRAQINYEEIQSNINQIFQDKTLRPILKFQNEVLLSIYNDYMYTNKLNFKVLSEDQINLKIEQSIK